MDIKEKLKSVRDNCVIHQVNKAVFPRFADSEVRRYRILFHGRVQKVGFRLEVEKLAERLGLTGFCKNLENGDVLAEFQGEKNRIVYLVRFMESLKRIRIRKMKIAEIPIVENENIFERR